MNVKRHCELLMMFNDRGVRFSLYMGFRWFISKAIIAIAIILMFFSQDEVFSIIGYILLGYLIGVFGENVRSYVMAKAKWDIQKEFIDWNKVEQHLKDSE